MTALRQIIPSFLEKAAAVHVLVAGDCMLDTYISGAASRISPEAPVPVVNVSRRRYVAGGAANVAANARALGAPVSLAGVSGIDDSAVRLRECLAEARINAECLVEDGSRPTTTKTRITAAGQQIVRFDDEDLTPVAAAVFLELQHRCGAMLEICQAVVISDYAKGVIGDGLCRWLIDQAEKRRLPVVADPKSRHLERYRGATVITPNLKEAEAAGGDFQSLLGRIAPSALLVTRGGDGMSLFERGRPERHLPAFVNEVADVTGAGDTVVAALAVALGAGFDLELSMAIANVAAGVAVTHHGTWAVKKDELLEAGLRLNHLQINKLEAAPAC